MCFVYLNVYIYTCLYHICLYCYTYECMSLHILVNLSILEIFAFFAEVIPVSESSMTKIFDFFKPKSSAPKLYPSGSGFGFIWLLHEMILSSWKYLYKLELVNKLIICFLLLLETMTLFKFNFLRKIFKY